MIPQVSSKPPEIEVNWRPPTATGTLLLAAIVPLPRLPYWLVPQHSAVPSGIRAHVCKLPDAIADETFTAPLPMPPPEAASAAGRFDRTPNDTLDDRAKRPTIVAQKARLTLARPPALRPENLNLALLRSWTPNMRSPSHFDSRLEFAPVPDGAAMAQSLPPPTNARSPDATRHA